MGVGEFHLQWHYKRGEAKDVKTEVVLPYKTSLRRGLWTPRVQPGVHSPLLDL